ncbi:hypothetical protein [Hydrogenophaga sp.]|uniref:SCO family protein n=1 Tax=Hydrogenophaga sp. TaxID=1904254 RepID=UPI0019CD3A6B|nr:hypothetical protein [Hydrogenophaga sp.]MBD3892803.1 hypothetical protein [Hydrogenophaga sp.]
MAQPSDEARVLTLHSLPQPGSSGLPGAARTRAGRWKMLALLLVCAAPVLASYFSYHVLRPEGRRNYGELIVPLRPLPAFSGSAANGQQVALTQLKDQWLLISVADSACAAACQRHLHLQRQLRETLGKEKGRLDWVWLRTGAAPLSEPLQQATASAQVLQVDEQELAGWLQPAPGQDLPDHLYLVDPQGNWMLRFPAHLDPQRARRDLHRLLRASSFWDQPGRPPP